MIPPLRTQFHRQLRLRAEHLASRVAPYLEIGKTILDVGSGTGHNAEALRRKASCSCVETDVVDFHVVGRGPVLFDGVRLPFADRVFEVCLLAFVLRYPDDAVNLLREAGRVARRRVLVFQSSPHGRAGRLALGLRSWLEGRFAFWLCSTLRLIPRSRAPLRPRRMLSRERVGALADEAGLKLLRIEPELGWLGLLSRDLFVMECPPVGPGQPAAIPQHEARLS